MRRKLVTTIAALALAVAPVALVGPAAHANPAGCSIDYVTAVSNPPAGTRVVYIENDKFQIHEVSVRPGEAVLLVNYATGATVAYAECVV